MALIALTGRFGITKARLDHVLRRTRGTCNAIGPTPLANGLITLRVIDEILDVALLVWTPVRDGGLRWRSIHYPQMPRPWNPKRASVKTTEVDGPECGFDNGKKVQGRKRHVLIDTLGLLLIVVVTAASLSEQSGARAICKRMCGTGKKLRIVWINGTYRSVDWTG